MSLRADLQIAFAHFQAGNVVEAEAAFRRIVKRSPAAADAHHLLGIIAHRAGRVEEARAHVQRAIAASPRYGEFYNTLGAIERAAGLQDSAIRNFEEALRLDPGNAQAAANLGNALAQSKRYPEAAASYRSALALAPGAIGIHNNLGNVLREMGDLDAAIASYRAALQLNPAYHDARANLGAALTDAGRPDEAMLELDRTLADEPRNALGLINRGNLWRVLGRLPEALKDYRFAAEVSSNSAEVHQNIAFTLDALGRYPEALESSRRALELNPNSFEAICTHGDIRMHQNRPAESAAAYARALALRPDSQRPLNGLAAAQNYLDDTTPETKRLWAARFASTFRRPDQPTPWQMRPSLAEGPLRVGIVSADLRVHSVAHFLLSFMGEIDRTSVQLIAFSNGVKEDSVTEKLRPLFDEWHKISKLSDTHAAETIGREEIDILIDLSGLTELHRLDLFAMGAAPVQASWLGYSGTTGLPEIDYILTDRWVAPPGSETQFVERPWRMTDAYLCFGQPPAPPVGNLPAHRSGGITFGSFNNLAKVGPRTLAAWGSILDAVPNSNMLIKSSISADPTRREEMRSSLEARGIDPGRMQFADNIPGTMEHLDLYNQVDIGLDPFPYNGTTTTCEALWMGVPVLTMRGDSFVSRVGETLLQTIGMPEWVADDDQDYVTRAISFASDLDHLAEVRTGLRDRFARSPLGDGRRFARSFEAAMWGMWKDKLARSSTDQD